MNIKTLPLSQLKPAPYNPRQSTKKQEEHLSASLAKFGIVEPIIFNEQTGYIVGGHFRVRELKKLGYKEVPCVVVDLSPEDERELNIRLNANTGGWDWDELANNFDMQELDDWGLDLFWKNEHEANNLNDEELDLGEEFDPIGSSTDLHKIVFIFDNETKASQFMGENLPNIEFKKFGGGSGKIWQVNFSKNYGLK